MPRTGKLHNAHANPRSWQDWQQLPPAFINIVPHCLQITPNASPECLEFSLKELLSTSAAASGKPHRCNTVAYDWIYLSVAPAANGEVNGTLALFCYTLPLP